MKTAVVLMIVIGSMKLSALLANLIMRWPINAQLKYWLVTGPGGGILGLLPAVLLTIMLGRFIFQKNIVQQWGGTIRLTKSAVFYGSAVGLGLAIFVVSMSWLTQSGTFYIHFGLSSILINVVSNLFEEILARGLLLQVLKDAFGTTTAIIVSGLVFGLMHGIDAKGIFIAFISWTIAWAVIKAKSLWAGWIAHQVSDMLIDAIVH